MDAFAEAIDVGGTFVTHLLELAIAFVFGWGLIGFRRIPLV
jgi:hypothetical protein